MNEQEQVMPRLSGREIELNLVRGFLVGDSSPSKILLFVGSPKIGKTYLLNFIVEDIEAQRFEGSKKLVVLRIPCNERGIWDKYPKTYITWSILQLWLRDKLKEQFQKQELEWGEELNALFKPSNDIEARRGWDVFFEDLGRISDIKIVFLLDDIDKAWPFSERQSEDALVAQDFAHFATASNVKVVASARKPILTADYHWIGLLGEDHACNLINHLLKHQRKNAEEWPEAVLENAGYHPFLITELCNFVLRDQGEKRIKDTISRWQSSDSIQRFLGGLKNYIDEYVEIGTIDIYSALSCVLCQDACMGYEDEINFLEKWGIIRKQEGRVSISSNLLQQAAENWLKGGVNRIARFWQYWDTSLFFWLTYVSSLAVLISIGLLRVLESRWSLNPNIAIIWLIIPLVYAVYGGLASQKVRVDD